MFGRKKKSKAQPLEVETKRRGMLGRKKSKAQSADVETRGRRRWEHHNVTVSGFGTLGSEKATEVINKMTRAGWDFVSQSSSQNKYGQMINIVFRRPETPGAPKPPVGSVVAQRAGCCLFFAMMPFALGATMAMLRRVRRGTV